MKKHIGLSSLIVVLVATSHLSATRLWLPEQIKVGGIGAPYNCGRTPSLVLVMGAQPVVSNYNSATPSPTIVRRTPIDWETWNPGVFPGNIAGNGARAIVSSTSGLVNYGANQTFYMGTGTTGSYPLAYQNGSWTPAGPQWTFATGATSAVVNADALGTVYMASGGKLAMVNSNNTWSTAIDFLTGSGTSFGLTNISDLAVSPFGEVALSGDNGSSERMVVWFDYKTGQWAKRTLTLTPAGTGSGPQRIGLGWDKDGNLGVAYSETNGSGSLVKFDYLDIFTESWSSEIVYAPSTAPVNPFDGTALAFDRYNNPVIASGNYLIYDPVATPEPASIFLFGLAAVAFRRTRK